MKKKCHQKRNNSKKKNTTKALMMALDTRFDASIICPTLFLFFLSLSLCYKKRMMRVKVALREATYKSIRLVHASTSYRRASSRRRRRSPGRGSRRWRPGGWRSTRRRLGRWRTRRRSRRWRSTQSRHGGSRCRGASQNASRASNATALRRRDGLLVRGNDGFLRVFSFGNSRGGVSRNFSRSVSAPKLDGVVVASRDKQVTG